MRTLVFKAEAVVGPYREVLIRSSDVHSGIFGPGDKHTATYRLIRDHLRLGSVLFAYSSFLCLFQSYLNEKLKFLGGRACCGTNTYSQHALLYAPVTTKALN